MKKFPSIAMILLFFGTPAFAYLPPTHFFVRKIVQDRDELNRLIISISVFRPADTAKGQEQLLWEEKIPLPSNTKEEHETAWPLLPTLFETDENKLLQAWKHFGLPAPAEQELLRLKKEQYQAAKEMPHPFYKQDASVSLKRYRNGYAWVSASPNKEKSIFIDKDNFIPVGMQGPCPSDIDAITDSSGLNPEICEIQFDHMLFSKQSSARLGRLILKRSGKTALIFRFDKVNTNPSEPLWREVLQSQTTPRAPSQELANVLSYFLH